MQHQSRQCHVFRFCCRVELGKYQPQAVGVLRLNSGFAAGFEKPLQPFVQDSTDHRNQCNQLRYGLQGAASLPQKRKYKFI